jgi:hypothetical protein
MVWLLLAGLAVYSIHRITKSNNVFRVDVLVSFALLVTLFNFLGSVVQANTSDQLEVSSEIKYYVRDLREIPNGYFYSYSNTAGDTISIEHISKTLKVYTSKHIDKPIIIERYLVKDWEPFFGMIPLWNKDTYLIIPSK